MKKRQIALLTLIVLFFVAQGITLSNTLQTKPSVDPSRSKTTSNSPRPIPPPAAHDILWNRIYGIGGSEDAGRDLVECSGGGFAIAGYAQNIGAGSYDMWLVRTDASGNHQWNKTYGDTGSEWGRSIVECSGGGFAIVGDTNSYGAGNYDVWLVRTDASGNHQWNKTYGDTGSEWGRSIVECSGGGFAIVGYTDSYGAGDNDVWLVRTDSSGNHLWNYTFSTTNDDWGYGVVECSDGGFGITGTIDAGPIDGWVIRTNSNGIHLWNRTYDDVSCNAIVEVSGGGLVVTGGSARVWLAYIGASGTLLWNYTYNIGWGASLVERGAGGFAITGVDDSGANRMMFLVRTDADGNLLWSHTYGYEDRNEGFAIVECTGGGYAVTGFTGQNPNHWEMWLVRVPEDTPPTRVQVPTDQIVALGDPFRYDLNATDSSGLDEWWITGTASPYFTIDSDGVVTNPQSLPPDVFTLEVWVNDTYDNRLSCTFTVTVIQVIPGFSVEAIAIGAAAALGLVLVIRRHRHRRRKP